MNETNETMTLDDLIQRGLVIRAQRDAEEHRRRAEAEEMRARELAEEERAIRNLLPPALVKLAEIDIRGSNTTVRYAYISVSHPFSGSGSVKIRAKKDRFGQWWLEDYEATNPDGYYLRLQTLEEAVAYAAGALEI